MPRRSNGGMGAPESPSRQQSKILRGPQRRVGAEKEESISVKQVQVKHIDRNVANLRAAGASRPRHYWCCRRFDVSCWRGRVSGRRRGRSTTGLLMGMGAGDHYRACQPALSLTK